MSRLPEKNMKVILQIEANDSQAKITTQVVLISKSVICQFAQKLIISQINHNQRKQMQFIVLVLFANIGIAGVRFFISQYVSYYIFLVIFYRFISKIAKNRQYFH